MEIEIDLSVLNTYSAIRCAAKKMALRLKPEQLAQLTFAQHIGSQLAAIEKQLSDLDGDLESVVSAINNVEVGK